MLPVVITGSFIMRILYCFVDAFLFPASGKIRGIIFDREDLIIICAVEFGHYTIRYGFKLFFVDI